MSEDEESPERMLVRSLEEVGKRLDAGADDWQHSLLMTYRRYSLAIGIQPHLLVPLQKMLFEVDYTIRKERRLAQPGTPKPDGEVAAMIVSAACVTVLKQRGDYRDIKSAVRAVAKATGIPAHQIENARGQLSRRGKWEQYADIHHYWLAVLKNWPSADMLRTISGLHKYVP